MPSDSAATVTVVPPCTNTKRTVTSTISPGATLSTSLPSSREPGEPETHIIIPGGSGFPETHTVTSTLPGKHLPDRTIVLPGRDPPPGETKTEVTVIPPTTTGLEGKVTACPPEVTVTVTRQASAAPMVNVSNEHGEVIKKPASKFPCSDNDLNPCRGTQVKPWTGFSVVWNAQYPRPGQPAPFATTIDYPYDTLLTVTDDEYQAEHWTIKLDGAKIGESHEEGFMNNKLYCGKDADGCIAKGFSHGTFMIPKGAFRTLQHSIMTWLTGISRITQRVLRMDQRSIQDRCGLELVVWRRSVSPGQALHLRLRLEWPC